MAKVMGILGAIGRKAAEERAAQQGFTNPQYHGSMQDFESIVPGYSDGLFFTTPNPDFASEWAGKGKMQSRSGELEAYDRYKPQQEKLYEFMGSPKYGTSEYDEFARLSGIIYQQEKNAFKTVYPLLARTENTFDPEKNFDDIADLFDKERLNAPFSVEYPTYADALKGGNYSLYENPEVVRHLKAKGYDSMFLRESTGSKEAREAPYTTVAHFYPERNIRSRFADFAEGYTGPNILGSAAGTAGVLGLLAAPEDAEAGFVNRGGRTLLEAFHGSPYQFDRFDMSKIGTGEGAQAYGHGLYFADSEDVARNYRDMLSSSSEEMETAVWALGRMGNDREAAIKALETGEGLRMAGPQSLFDDAAKLLRDEADLSGPGALYRAEIDVTPESLLHWDKPLSEQSEAVQEVLGPYKSDFSPSTGGALNLAKDALGKGEPERLLSEKGIKGIKYLDGDSRGAGDGTSNYVIFDDGLINIAERYAIAPPMFAPSQDRALAAANQGLLDPLTVDEQRIATHNMDVNKQMAKLGLLADPMYEYGNIIPAKTNIVTGETSLAFPAIARDIIGGLLDLANTRRSGVYNPAALMDVAL